MNYDSKYTGAVHGDTIIELMKKSRLGDIDFVDEENNLIIRPAGKSKPKIQLSSMPLDGKSWVMPALDKSNQLLLDIPTLVDALKDCRRSVTDNALHPEMRGITIIPESNNSIHLFSFTGHTISHVNVPVKNLTLKTRAILPHAFCDQIIALGNIKEGDPKPYFEIGDDHALFVVGDISVYGKLIETDKTHDFMDILTKHFNDKNAKIMVDVPTSLNRVLDQAIIIMADGAADSQTTVAITKGRGRLTSTGGRGEIDTVIKLDGHPDLVVKINPKYLKTGCEDGLSKILFTKQAIVMTDDKQKSIYLIAMH